MTFFIVFNHRTFSLIENFNPLIMPPFYPFWIQATFIPILMVNLNLPILLILIWSSSSSNKQLVYLTCFISDDFPWFAKSKATPARVIKCLNSSNKKFSNQISKIGKQKIKFKE